MITSKMSEALNNQINAEIYSSYLYMAMSGHFANAGLKGAANWFFIQTQEELIHAQKLYDYVLSHGSEVTLKQIDAPPSKFGTPIEVFQMALEHEQKVTALINDLVSVAADEKDKATDIFLNWFVTEQVEEEENANEIIDKFKLAGDNGPGLFMIDSELATRVYTPPAQL